MKNLPTRDIGLTIFRLLLSFLVIRGMFLYFNYSDLLFGKDGIAPYQQYEQQLESLGLSFMKIPFELFPPHYYLWCVVALTFLFALGIGKWFTGALLYVAILNLHLRNPLILDGSDNIILVTLPFVIIADAHRHYSYNWPRFSCEQTGAFHYIRQLAAWGFMLQICIVYFVTGIVKLNTDVWFNGTANYYILQLHEFEATKWNIVLARNALFAKATTWATLVFEILFPFAVLYRPAKYAWLLFGLLFHLGIWFFMRIDVFPWIMIATYFVFITDAEYHAFWKWGKKIVMAEPSEKGTAPETQPLSIETNAPDNAR